MCLAALDNLSFLTERPYELQFVSDALPGVISAFIRLWSDNHHPSAHIGRAVRMTFTLP